MRPISPVRATWRPQQAQESYSGTWTIRTGHDSAAVLGVILAFFGGGLLVLCLKTALKKEKASESDAEGDTYEEH